MGNNCLTVNQTIIIKQLLRMRIVLGCTNLEMRGDGIKSLRKLKKMPIYSKSKIPHAGIVKVPTRHSSESLRFLLKRLNKTEGCFNMVLASIFIIQLY